MQLCLSLVRVALMASGCIVLSGCSPSTQSTADEQKELHFLQGKQLVTMLDYKGAIDSFEKALESNPRSASAHFELGLLCDQKDANPAAAIYHFQQYLRLRPEAENTNMVNTRIIACKQELAKTVSLGPITEALQSQLEGLIKENRKLKDEVASYSSRLAALTNSPVPVPVRAGQSQPDLQTTASTPSSSMAAAASRSSTTQPGANRNHTVKAGENPAVIARKYGVELKALMAANPKLDPRRLKVGQTLNIPTS
jgi:LysM repeat protein